MLVVIHREGLAMEACEVSSLLGYNDIYNEKNERDWEYCSLGNLN